MIGSDPDIENGSKEAKKDCDDSTELSLDVTQKQESAPGTSSSSDTEKDSGSVGPEEKTIPEASGTLAVAGGVGPSTQGRRASSYELRCVPVNILFKPSPSEVASILSDDHLDSLKRDGDVGKTDLLHRLCLRPGYTLKTQMMLSFGTINLVTILFVVLTCIALTILAGDGVYSSSEETFNKLGFAIQGKTSRYLAEALSPRLVPLDLLNFLHEGALDRFSGYPDPSDSQVPFMDMVSGENKYPIIAPPLPLEWELDSNVNAENKDEHLQSRWAYYQTRPANTVNAAYHFQGICNPNSTLPSEHGYRPGCTEANNDIQTGGVVAPSNLTEMIHRKSSDLVPLMRALYETREEVRDMGLYFMNDGVGSSVTYPHYALVPNSTYISTGCDWMATPHPYHESRTIGTQSMIDKCHARGEVVDGRDYNPMERQWCVSQALNPEEPVVLVGPDAWDNGHWLMFIGKAVYDRLTKDFIACSYVGISLRLLDEELKKAQVAPLSDISIATWDRRGTVVVSSKDPYGSENRQVSVYDAGIGVTQDIFDELLALVDFDSEWDPEEVREKYEKFTRRNDGFFVSSYPIPSIPNVYDPTYKPYYLLFSSIAEGAIFQELEGVGDIVDEKVSSVTLFSILAGVVGFLASTLIIGIMANMLTSPLRSMNEIAQEIVYNFGDPTKEQLIDGTDGQLSKEARCTPKTELSDVVKEFNILVKSFSGSSMAKSEKGKHTEVENLFTLSRAFSDVYSGRDGDEFEYSIEPTHKEDYDFVHNGSNLTFTATTATTYVTSKPSKQSGRFSPLFLWTVGLIVTPLLATSVIISAVVMAQVKTGFTEGLDASKVYFRDFQVDALSVHAKLRSDLVSELTSKASHDLHVFTRYLEWLLFGAIERTDSFTAIETGIEACKLFENTSECPFVAERSRCDCDFNDGNFGACRRDNWAPRDSQPLYFSTESLRTAPDGNRNSTGFPDDSYSPETTAWWVDASFLPGWEKGALAEGHSSSYDRLRVASAVPIYQAIFNYDPFGGSKMADFVAFEGDGTLLGYDSSCGSAYGHASLSGWSSTEENGAAMLRPELCPLGKYGFDPRCRGWYDTGRNLALNEGISLHITAPYLFAGETGYAQSVTEPLIDPRSGEHVGQTLIDFRADDIYDVLGAMTELFEGGFPILITSQGAKDDSVVAPGFTIFDGAKPIAELLLPLDYGCTSSDCAVRVDEFENIVKMMKEGKVASSSFRRKNDDGEIEVVHLAFAPVLIRNHESVDSSDYSRGISVSKYQVYTLGLGGTESGILKPFNAVEEGTRNQIQVAIGVVCVVLLVAAVFVIYISHTLTKSITEPMLYLLELIRSVNRHGADQDPPDLKTVKASKEIVTFSYTMEMLYKALRSANAAFYAGALEAAYLVLVDALRLFKRLDNKKAIGIASNNLGNTMLAIYREMELENLNEVAGLSKKQVLVKGVAYFHESIQLGEKAYDEFYNEQGWSPICLDFMQHLANRYFNRGLFLLTVKESHKSPKECERLGHRDLEIARDMDLEVIAYGEEIGWGSSDRPEKLFDVKLVRLRGYNILLSLGYPDVWETEELFDEAFDIIKTEAKRNNSELFATVSVAGRLQEIETELMKFKLHKGEIETAAKIAIRMLREDEKVFIDAEAQAVDVLLEYLMSDAGVKKSSTLKKELADYREMLNDMVDNRKQAALEDLESDSALTRSTRHTTTDRLGGRVSSNWALASSSGRFVTMEDF